MRKHATKAEDILWQAIRGSKLGEKFIRQKPFTFEYNEVQRTFIADFYCSKAKLIIEVDGHIHDDQKEYDELRTEIIKLLGMKVIRFTNEQVINDIEKVKQVIKEYLGTT